MPLQSSGPISLGNMHAFFGLGYTFSSYRGRGSVPASGPISFSQMYGATLREPSSGQYYSYSGATSGNVSGVPANTSYGVTSVQSSGTAWSYKWAGSTIASGSGGSPASYASGGWTYYRGSVATNWTYYNSRNSTYTYYYIYGIYRIK